MASLEQKEQLLNHHLTVVESSLHMKVATQESLIENAKSHHFWPFVFLFAFVLGAGAYMYKKVRDLRTQDDYWGSLRSRSMSRSRSR